MNWGKFNILINQGKNRWTLAVAVALFATCFDAFGGERTASVLQCSYVVKPGDTLSNLLFEKGIGSSSSKYRLYGKSGWVKKNKDKNPAVMDWTQMSIGSEISLLFPKPMIERCPKENEKVVVVPIQVKPPDQAPQVAPRISARPDQPKRPIPEPAKREVTAKSDINMPNLRELTSGSVDFRYSKSLEPSGDTLILPKLAQYSLVFESRYEALNKVRIYFDYMPRVSEEFLEKTFYLDSMRIFLGRSFFWEMGPIATLELTPKIGYWRYESVLPLLGSDGIQAVELVFKSQLSMGGDIAISRKFGWITPRLWHGREFTANLIKNTDSAAGQNYRTGIETKFDGPDFPMLGASAQMHVVAFLMNESTKITNGTSSDLSGAKDSLGQANASSDDDRKDVDYHVNYAGLGLGLSW
jgi:hypothetical protein